jgi:hypothetical protein
MDNYLSLKEYKIESQERVFLFLKERYFYQNQPIINCQLSKIFIVIEKEALLILGNENNFAYVQDLCRDFVETL